MANGGDQATMSNRGLEKDGLGNKLVKDESTRIKLLILKNTPNKQNLTQRGTTLALMPGKDGVSYDTMKVPKSGVTNGSCFRPTST